MLDYFHQSKAFIIVKSNTISPLPPNTDTICIYSSISISISCLSIHSAIIQNYNRFEKGDLKMILGVLTVTAPPLSWGHDLCARQLVCAYDGCSILQLPLAIFLASLPQARVNGEAGRKDHNHSGKWFAPFPTWQLAPLAPLHLCHTLWIIHAPSIPSSRHLQSCHTCIAHCTLPACLIVSYLGLV